MSLKPEIVSVGAGNVASHLIPEFLSKGYPIKCVYSRTIQAASHLAGIVGSDFTDDLNDLPASAGIYIISLSDDAIMSAVDALSGNTSVVVHTAGSVDLSIFKGNISRHGVIYPLQTFTKDRKLDISGIPFFLEAGDHKTLQFITSLVSDISGKVQELSSEDRKFLHLSAVFACNFVNYMYTCAYDLMAERDFDFSILRPLVEETMNKAFSGNPSEMQTGPAIRGNNIVIGEHLNILSKYEDRKDLYDYLSHSIKEYYKSNKQDTNGQL